jgi:hypothetical protein
MNVILFSLVFLFSCLHAAEHPRLLLSPKDLPELRAKVRREPVASMARKLLADVDMTDWGRPSAPGEADSEYAQLLRGHRHAFLYVLGAGDKHAVSAREALEKNLANPNWANPRTKGLTLYIRGIYASFIYDHCYGAPSWDAAFSKKVSADLLRMHDVIVKSGGSEQNNSPASNWQALRAAAAGITLMATDEATNPANLTWAFQRMSRYLDENAGKHPETRGWNIEGLGYTFYPYGNGVMPFVLAARRHNEQMDLLKHPGLRMSLWTTYAALVPSSRGLLRPDFGDDNPGANGEGCYGFAFAVSPPELLPGLKYWYDRTVGVHGDKSFDNSRFGTVASILYYPEQIPAAPPLSIPEWVKAFLDRHGNGFMTFRGQYKDATDVVVQLYLKLKGNKGHSGPDALSFRIAGLDTLFATGGGRYGTKTNGQDVYLRSMNTLYPVDPDSRLSTSGDSGRIVGEPVIRPDGSGYVVAQIQRNNVGVVNHVRRFATAFGKGANTSVVISDTSDNGAFWQICTVDQNPITTAGNTFTFTTAAGHSMKGTVLHPANPLFKTGKRPRGSDALGTENNNFLHFSAADGDYLVVLTLVEKGGVHPPVQAQGSWGGSPRGSVRVGTQQVDIDGDAVKMLP